MEDHHATIHACCKSLATTADKMSDLAASLRHVGNHDLAERVCDWANQIDNNQACIDEARRDMIHEAYNESQRGVAGILTALVKAGDKS